MSIHRLYGFYHGASRAQLNLGRTWYPRARVAAWGIAYRYNVEKEVVAGVIAVLSPNCKWERNLVDAQRVLSAVEDGTPAKEVSVTAYGRNKAKAFKIAKTGDLSVISGPKVQPFSRALSGDDNAVVIDMHAINAYVGEVLVGARLKTPPRALAREVTAAFERCAEVTGENPCAFQAILWNIWRDRQVEQQRQH